MMTSTMQRPPANQSQSIELHYSRSPYDRSASHEHQHYSSYQQLGSSSELENQLASLQRELLGETGISSSMNLGGSSNELSGFDTGPSDHSQLTNLGGEEGEGEIVHHTLIKGESSSSTGLFEDPAVLALISEQQSTQLEQDYELNMAARATLSAQLSEDNISGQHSDADLTSAATFQFPELPASLLDQAPEYEYSVHTQANVFDAVQDYGHGGDDEANRIFSLEQYDPALLQAQNPNAPVGEDFWNYHDISGGAGSFHQGQLSDYATFQDSSSLSDYPEPSTAPSSRASDWKQDPLTGSFLNANQTSFMAPVSYTMKRRRDSFDATMNNSNVDLSSSAYGRPFDPIQYSMPHQGSHSMYVDVKPSRDVHPLITSQRSRMTSWGGEGMTGQYADDWPPPPAPAPLLGSMTNFGPRVGGGGMFNTTEMGHNNTHQGHRNTQLGMNNPMAARMRSTSSEAGGQKNDGDGVASSSQAAAATAARNASQNEMINALGSAMDASMESEGVAKCPYPNCSKTFAKNRSYNLKAHLRSHSQLKPFACNHCPRAFSRKHDLERHARVHSGDKPYICEACGKGFPRSDALRRHWRVEKECGDKAVEIEAGQPLPSLPPGLNTVAAQSKAPMPGMMPTNGPMATSTSSNNSSASHQMLMSGYTSFAPSQHWDNNNNSFPADNYAYQQPDRKRARGDY